MSLRINHNIASVNGHRNMVKNDMAISKSLEKLSSGLRINRAADDSAGLVISEQMRAQITGLHQAIDNSETAVAMVQTAEGALDEINSLLNKARELALHAANAGTNDTNQLVADQKELDNAIESISRIATQTQFGTKKLIDGSLAGANNYDTTKIHQFDVGSALLARSDFKIGSVNVSVTTAGTASTLSISGGATALTGAAITEASFVAGGVSATMFTAAGAVVADISAAFTTVTNRLAEGASATFSVNDTDFRFESGESVSDMLSFINNAQSEYTLAGAGGAGSALLATRKLLGVSGEATDLNVRFTAGVKADAVTAATAGTSAAVSTAATKTAGVQTVGQLAGVSLGGVSTTIALVADTFDASILRGNAYGISIDVTNAFAGATGNTGASLTKAALFQVGANAAQQTAVDIKSVKAFDLGLGGDSRTSGRIENLNSLKSAQSLVNGDFKGAIEVIDRAIDDVTNLRGQLGAFQANTLESGLNSLRVAQENLTAAESTIRDVDFASESASFTRNNILVQAATAMLAQANQMPQNVLKLLT